MAGIKKTQFNFEALQKKFSKEAEYKPERFFDLGDAFLDATGIPGPAMGHINMLFCLLYTSPSPRDRTRSRMPSSA